MPSTHVQTVSKGHIILLDSIISGRPIDVGAIIFQSLITCAAKKCGSLWFPSLITSLCANSGVPMFDTEQRLSCSNGAIKKATIARLLNVKMAKVPSQPLHNQEDEAGQAPQAPTSNTAAASSSRDPNQVDLASSVQMFEQRMSLAEVHQYQTMEMLQQMHSQQQQYWEYAKQRDLALKKSLQKNFTKPIFPFPEFPEGVLEPITDEEVSDEVDEEDADDQED
ncbi:hypothetical protein TIFTF001_027608 [Ficus carica]|uniref:Putative plant transposon protein domain-containing protein n=1 Tax=Ficus carica TaxID=3494 RepID=A0AA88DNI3_FICCA|nr:hypothetical protein TIFTF001_027608 [Ficus carica]